MNGSIQNVVTIGWIFSVASALGVLYGLVPYLDEEATPVINPLYRVAYGCLHRLVWAAAIGWVIVACANGYGGMKLLYSQIKIKKY